MNILILTITAVLAILYALAWRNDPTRNPDQPRPVYQELQQKERRKI